MRARRTWIGVAAVACLLLAGCDSISAVTSNRTPDSRCFTNSLSADGRYIAFTTLSDPSGQTQLQQSLVRKADGTGSVKLAGDGSDTSTRAAVSGDGGSVAYQLFVRSGGEGRRVGFVWHRSSGVRT
ncbi:hypothetical protein BH10ACT1_BH10ACT1_06140 [soil metagenome]